MSVQPEGHAAYQQEPVSRAAYQRKPVSRAAHQRKPESQALYQRESLAGAPYQHRGGWEVATWTGPSRSIGFAASEIVPSWTARTPGDSWIKVELQVPGSRWYVMGRWSYEGVRTTVKGQSDGFGRVAADVFKARRPIGSYRLRVEVYRRAGSAVQPEVLGLGAVASARGRRAVERGGAAWGRELAVPRKSQLAHADHGGKGWCSPTSTAMVLAYWRSGGRGVHDLSVRAGGGHDVSVDEAAEHTYDRAYGGTGNWAFNTAYAGNFGLDAHVTRMRSLAEAERLIRKGVPVVTSLAFRRKELGYDTDGHLMVVTGFTRTGDVIVNDPALRTVRTFYPRQPFERAWQRASSGTAYVIRPLSGHAITE